ncbi:hypothetical protein QPL79_07925 [Ignisphaera sp. 4213-co]|uniref:DUF4352 domain-containing protein n=1 Tax=Ignisphaera cupida TaxID=3050454 RepID=A0ABD4Z7G0_9CREN|nr:hypothetical protein [Ignisphaera sp. 4213-co]MDK6029287.1 hypothetical protein [Ignisphaera sp. 4213-co]
MYKAKRPRCIEKIRKGLSEAVVIMIVILIAVVVGFAIKSWYDAQVRKLPATDMAVAEWSATFSQGKYIVAVNVRNNLDRNLQVIGYRVTLANGSTVNNVNIIPALPQTLNLKSSQSFVITIPVKSSSDSPISVEVQVQDTSTETTAWIKAVGGIQM